MGGSAIQGSHQLVQLFLWVVRAGQRVRQRHKRQCALGGGGCCTGVPLGVLVSEWGVAKGRRGWFPGERHATRTAGFLPLLII